MATVVGRDSVRRRRRRRQLFLNELLISGRNRGFVADCCRCMWVSGLIFLFKLHLSSWWLGSVSFSQARQAHGIALLPKHVAGCLLGTAAAMLGDCTAQKEGSVICSGGLATQPQNKSPLQQQRSRNPVAQGSKPAASRLCGIFCSLAHVLLSVFSRR